MRLTGCCVQPFVVSEGRRQQKLGDPALRPRRAFEPVRPAVAQSRINEAIRVPKVRLVDSDGTQIGIKPRDEALEYAYSKNLDLVEVAAGADPPVCRVMDYGKYRYEQEQKAKLARKHQSQIHVKEIKLRPKIGDHDYETKKGHVVRFLEQRAKVKVTIMFRGRETTASGAGARPAHAPRRGREGSRPRSSRSPSSTGGTWSWCSRRTRTSRPSHSKWSS